MSMRFSCMAILFLIAGCAGEKAPTQAAVNPGAPGRMEYSKDTGFNEWDSLLLVHTYQPIKRNLTAFDKEWYVIYDPSEKFCGYINMKGDTVIPLKYGNLPFATDTFRNFAFVYIPNQGFMAINKNEEIVFEPYFFDNGPDYTSDGLFRIKREGKVGFANEEGSIVIQPLYDDASPFQKGFAVVGFNCYKEMLHDEHNPTHCRQNGIINRQGKLLFLSTNEDSTWKVYEKYVGD